MTTTSLQFLINRMNVYTPIRVMDEVLKVNALDQALRMFRMNNNPPWTKQKTTLRVFLNVPLYPTPTDFAQLSILDDPLGQDLEFGDHPRYVYTSVRDFLEDPTNRNTIAEVWEAGTKFLGVKNISSANLTQQMLDSAGIVADWATSGDAGTPVLDQVVFLTGSTSIRIPITFSSGTATITDTYQNAISDSNYKTKYYFRYVYFGTSVPSSVSLKLRTDASNYLSSGSITTQFAGVPFVANDWNLISFDLNTATPTGTVTGTFTDEQWIITDTTNGTYYFDQSFLRGWILQDMWYYSTYNILNGTTYQDFFAPDSATYSLSSVLLGDTNWHDPIMYEACTYLLSDQKEQKIYADVSGLRDKGWEQFFSRYPDETPQISTNEYRFATDYQDQMGWPDFMIR